MPIHLPVSRRQFMWGGMAAAVGATVIHAEEQSNPHRWALLADTHIAGDPAAKRGDTCMAENLERVVSEITQHKAGFGGAIIHGDCAFLDGQTDDYRTLGTLLEPFTKAKIPTHLTLGNHDHRDHFLSGMSDRVPEHRPVPAKHVSIVKSERANFFLLDTLEFVNKTPGLLGSQQLDWLAESLDAHANKPALISLHHNPNFAQVLDIGGLKDTPEFWKILVARKHVKAVFFGHTHHWSKLTQNGIHCVNLPPTAYVFQKPDPNGWVELLLEENSARLIVHALDAKHPSHHEKIDLPWRS